MWGGRGAGRAGRGVGGGPADSAKTVNSQIVSAQGRDEWLASKLRGTTVLGSDNQKVGDVVDILLDKSGQVRAFIVGVGGVLGLRSEERRVGKECRSRWSPYH